MTALETWAKDGLPADMFEYPPYIKDDIRVLLIVIQDHIEGKLNGTR